MPKMTRDEYYMRMALIASLRGTCSRRQVGAVIVHDDRALATGFNGAPRGLPECDEVGHLMEHGHCVRTIHAEANAIMYAGGAMIKRLARVNSEPVTIYTTTAPCMGCMNLIVNSHIQRVVWGEVYSDDSHKSDRQAYARDTAKALGIEWVPFALDDEDE